MEVTMRSLPSHSRIVLLAVALAACNASSLTATVSRPALVVCPLDVGSSATVADTVGHDVALSPKSPETELAKGFPPAGAFARGAYAEEARPVCTERVSPFLGTPGRRTGAAVR
jgi:hypothetical protein